MVLLPAKAQVDTIRERTVRTLPGNAPAQEHTPLFTGAALSVDVAGMALAAATSYGQYEAALRVSLKRRFFPTVEAGWGTADHDDESTSIRFRTGAPYARIGCDYNFLRDLRSGNRLFGGVRLGYTAFKYDISAPDVPDPVSGTPTPFRFDGVSSSAAWGELLFGLEARIWKSFHIGWSARYKVRLRQTYDEPGQAWYVPGFGKNGKTCLSGTFNLVFDI